MLDTTRHWVYKSEQDKYSVCPQGVSSLVGESNNTQPQMCYKGKEQGIPGEYLTLQGEPQELSNLDREAKEELSEKVTFNLLLEG